MSGGGHGGTPAHPCEARVRISQPGISSLTLAGAPLLRDTLQTLVTDAVRRLVEKGSLPSPVLDVSVEVDVPKTTGHGDFMTNFALVAAKAAGSNPRVLAEALSAELQGKEYFESVEVAGPGFVNFTLAPVWVAGFLADVQSPSFAKGFVENPQKINVEFVSVNPNGPITVGSGRGAAYGSTLCNVLEAAGHTVHREYYINDGVNSEQMRLFAESVRSFVEGTPFPEKGYKGDYVQAVADSLRKDGSGSMSVAGYQEASQRLMIEAQREATTLFGVTYDTWFSEQSLHDGGQVQQEFDALIASGAADDGAHRLKLKMAKGGVVEDVEIEDQAGAKAEAEEGDLGGGGQDADGKTVWLRSTKFGDDMDRVLRRRDGRLTYIASDVAYHKDKFNRPPDADRLITVLGPDHHGYIGRLTAVVAAMLLAGGKVKVVKSDEPLSDTDAKVYSSTEERDTCRAATALARERLRVLIFQIVRFVKDGKPAPMRKRDGNIYALIDLVNEIGERTRPNGTAEERQAAGRDVARFFYLMRHHDTAMDFDLDLAEKQSDENPVFYVQYAHARICSVLDKAKEAGFGSSIPESSDDPLWVRLTDAKERALVIKVLDLRYEIERCAGDYGVNRLTTYAVELARTYHAFYDSCRVVQPDEPELTRARVALCVATRNALRGTFDLLGISAPDRMTRDAD